VADLEWSVNLPVLYSLGANCRKISALILSPLNKTLQFTTNQNFPSLHSDDDCLLVISQCWPLTLKILSFDARHVTLSAIAMIGQFIHSL